MTLARNLAWLLWCAPLVASLGAFALANGCAALPFVAPALGLAGSLVSWIDHERAGRGLAPLTPAERLEVERALTTLDAATRALQAQEAESEAAEGRADARCSLDAGAPVVVALPVVPVLRARATRAERKAKLAAAKASAEAEVAAMAARLTAGGADAGAADAGGAG